MLLTSQTWTIIHHKCILLVVKRLQLQFWCQSGTSIGLVQFVLIRPHSCSLPCDSQRHPQTHGSSTHNGLKRHAHTSLRNLCPAFYQMMFAMHNCVVCQPRKEEEEEKKILLIWFSCSSRDGNLVYMDWSIFRCSCLVCKPLHDSNMSAMGVGACLDFY